MTGPARTGDGRVAALLHTGSDGPLFFAGCSQEQVGLPFDSRVLLTAPAPVLLERLRTRTGNPEIVLEHVATARSSLRAW